MKFKTISVSNIWGALHGMRNPKDSWALSDTLTYTVDQNVETVAKLWSTKTDKNSNPMIYDDAIDWLFAQIRDGNRDLIGPNDMRLAQTLIDGGSEHRKYLRQIQVCVDITAPMYWFSEFDTYKIGTTANSTSKMHKLLSYPITKDRFEMDDYDGSLEVFSENNEHTSPLTFVDDIWENDIKVLEALRLAAVNIDKKLKDKNNQLSKEERIELTKLEQKYWKELLRKLPNSWLQTRTVTLNYENIRSMVHQRRGHKLTEWRKTFINWATTLPYANELIFYNNN